MQHAAKATSTPLPCLTCQERTDQHTPHAHAETSSPTRGREDNSTALGSQQAQAPSLALGEGKTSSTRGTNLKARHAKESALDCQCTREDIESAACNHRCRAMHVGRNSQLNVDAVALHGVVGQPRGVQRVYNRPLDTKRGASAHHCCTEERFVKDWYPR